MAVFYKLILKFQIPHCEFEPLPSLSTTYISDESIVQ